MTSVAWLRVRAVTPVVVGDSAGPPRGPTFLSEAGCASKDRARQSSPSGAGKAEPAPKGSGETKPALKGSGETKPAPLGSSEAEPLPKGSDETEPMPLGSSETEHEL
jgi:hypothetical protein